MALRIAFLTSTYPRFAGDGAGRFVQSIAEAVQARGHEVHVLAPFHPLVRPFRSDVQVHHFRYVWRDSMNLMGYAQAMQSDQMLKKDAVLLAPLYFVAAMHKLRQVLLSAQFDAIHTHWVIPNGPIALPLAQRFGLPLVVSLHGSDIFFALQNPLLGLLARMVFRRANAVTACSPELYNGALQLGAQTNRTALMPWGADPQMFAQTQSSEVYRQRWGIAANVPVLLSLGRLVHKKGIEHLVRAMPLVLRDQPQTILLVAGDGPERAHLQQVAGNVGVEAATRFVGEVAWSDVPGLLKLCDIFCVPSIHDARGNLDGLPTTILEAMAASRPVIASDVAGIPMAVQHEHTGLLVPEAQADALAAAILKLLNQPQLLAQYGQAGRVRVEQELNWQHVAAQFEKMYQPIHS